jgi:hypothetical protein
MVGAVRFLGYDALLWCFLSCRWMSVLGRVGIARTDCKTCRKGQDSGSSRGFGHPRVRVGQAGP